MAVHTPAAHNEFAFHSEHTGLTLSNLHPLSTAHIQLEGHRRAVVSLEHDLNSCRRLFLT